MCGPQLVARLRFTLPKLGAHKSGGRAEARAPTSESVVNHRLALLAVPLATSLIALTGNAHAGAASGVSHQLGVVISDDSGNSWDLSSELSSMLSFNGSTGDISLQAPTTVISGNSGAWVPNASVTLASGQVVSGLGWHSWMTASGSTANTTDASNPWAASLILTHVSGNVDPTMDYGFYFKNSTTATQTYRVTYGETIEPVLTGAYQVSASLAGATTNVDGSTTVAPLLGSASGLIQQLLLSSDGGDTLVNAGVDVGPGVSSSGTATYGPFEASATGTAPSAGYNYWTFKTQFALTGNKDVFVANGAAVITAVPEPESLALLGISLVLIGWRSRRQLR